MRELERDIAWASITTERGRARDGARGEIQRRRLKTMGASGECTLARGNRFPWPAWLEREATPARQPARLIHDVIIKGGNPDH